jgi:hypothetical protein
MIGSGPALLAAIRALQVVELTGFQSSRRIFLQESADLHADSRALQLTGRRSPPGPSSDGRSSIVSWTPVEIPSGNVQRVVTAYLLQTPDFWRFMWIIRVDHERKVEDAAFVDTYHRQLCR